MKKENVDNLVEQIEVQGKLTGIRSWLSHTDEDIPWEKIAGYYYHSGWFWDGIEIQTRGQKANSIGCLVKIKRVENQGNIGTNEGMSQPARNADSVIVNERSKGRAH